MLFLKIGIFISLRIQLILLEKLLSMYFRLCIDLVIFSAICWNFYQLWPASSYTQQCMTTFIKKCNTQKKGNDLAYS